MLIRTAGLLQHHTRIESLAMAEWHKVMRVNLDANLALLREAHALLKLAPHGGRVVGIGSQKLPPPPPRAAAPPAPPAAPPHLSRSSTRHTGRAAHYGLSIEQYKRKTLLKTEVTSRDVAELAAELCGPLFAKTTGAQIHVGGGNARET